MDKDLDQIMRDDPKALIPGSALYRWHKEDKKNVNKTTSTLGYVVYGIRDLGMAAIYGAAMYGLFKVGEEVLKNMPISSSFPPFF